jgi:HEAT repeat protein
VVEAFGKIGPADGSVAALLTALDDPDERVRKRAATSLDQLGQLKAEDVHVLRASLKSPDPGVRKRAVLGLTRTGKAALPALTEAMGDADVGIRLQAISGLGGLGPDAQSAVPTLADAVRKDPDRKVQRAAIEALGSIGPAATAGVRALIQVLDDPTLAEVAIQSLKQIGKPAVPELIKALSARRETVRLSAAVALGKIGPAARVAVEPLTACLQDPSAANALKDIRR